MGGSILPSDGSLLPTEAIIPVAFTYTPEDENRCSLLVNWHSDSYALKFADSQTRVNDKGIALNEICYKGDTPSQAPTITLRDASDDSVLMSFKYDFRLVSFSDYVMSYPGGIQTTLPFGEVGDPLKNGVNVLIRAIDPTYNKNTPVANFRVLFSTTGNVVTFYDTTGCAITPLPQGAVKAAALQYPCCTDKNGVASVIAMAPNAGIFELNAGAGSNGRRVEGQIVVLNEFPPPDEDLLDPLEFPTATDPADTIDLDASPGPTFPVRAPGSVLPRNPAMQRRTRQVLHSTDAMVVLTYDPAQGPGTAVIAGEVVEAGVLVQGVGIAKARAPVGGAQTSYYYLASDGVASWQSATSTMEASGTAQDGPDTTVPRLTGYLPELPDANVINAATIVGGLTVKADAFLVGKTGLVQGDGYQFNVYIDGWTGDPPIRKRDFFSSSGEANSGSGPIAEILPQEWFAGYTTNGDLQSTVQFEFVGFPRASQWTPIYSDVLQVDIDTSE